MVVNQVGHCSSTSVFTLFQILSFLDSVGIFEVKVHCPVWFTKLPMVIGPHWITGNGVGFKPDILDMDVMERVLEVSTKYD